MQYIYLVDSFTNQAFKGNPAGVCLVDNYPNIHEMQNLSKFFNWSEIAFIKQITNEEFEIHWFSPKDEATICGHATLASAYVIFKQKISNSNIVKFHSKSGLLTAELLPDGYIAMNFPVLKTTKCDSVPFDPVKIFGINSIKEIITDNKIFIIIMNNYEELINIKPKFELIKQVNARAIAVTSTHPNYDFCSRYFAPSVGIYEDPVCGSLHCRLAYYWGNKLKKYKLKALQASARSGILNLELSESHVRICGNAVLTAKVKV